MKKNRLRMVYFVEEFLANVIKEMSRKAVVGKKKVEGNKVKQKRLCRMTTDDESYG